MIPNQWYAIIESRDVPKARPLALRRCGEDLVVYRGASGRVVAQRDRCPHKGAKLSQGAVKDGTIRCPYHGFRYDGAGACVDVPCLGPNANIPSALQLHTFPTRERDGVVFMWWGDERHVYPDLPSLPETSNRKDVKARMSFQRPVHYTRYIESLLEYYHVPWVHGPFVTNWWVIWLESMLFYGTKKKLLGFLEGPSNYHAPVVANHVCTVEGTTIRSSFDMVHGDTPDVPRSHYEIVFQMPGYMHTQIFGGVEATMYFTPVDDGNVFIIQEYWEPKEAKFLVSRRLRRWGTAMGMYISQYIQDVQDLPLMKGLSPKASDLKAYRLVSTDELNAKFLHLRAKLIREAKEASEAAQLTPVRLSRDAPRAAPRDMPPPSSRAASSRRPEVGRCAGT